MARAWRIEYDGALYHVLSRGNERQDIFRGDEDRTLFLETVGEMSERYEMDIFAYVLMGNHYHLLLKTNRSNLSKGMQWLGGAFQKNRFEFISHNLLKELIYSAHSSDRLCKMIGASTLLPLIPPASI